MSQHLLPSVSTTTYLAEIAELVETEENAFRLIIFDIELFAYIEVLIIAIGIYVLYAETGIIPGNIEFVDEMPFRLSEIMRLAIENKDIWEIVDVVESSTNATVAWLQQFGVKITHTYPQMSIKSYYKLW